MKLACGGESVEVELDLGSGSASVAHRRSPVRLDRSGGHLRAVEIDGRLFPVRVVREGRRVFVWCGGRAFELGPAVAVPSQENDFAGGLVSPMPGRVRGVQVHVGERVQRGDVVVLLEAMKMEHAIRSPIDGVVTAISYSEGDLVEAGVKLAEIKA